MKDYIKTIQDVLAKAARSLTFGQYFNLLNEVDDEVEARRDALNHDKAANGEDGE